MNQFTQALLKSGHIDENKAAQAQKKDSEETAISEGLKKIGEGYNDLTQFLAKLEQYGTFLETESFQQDYVSILNKFIAEFERVPEIERQAKFHGDRIFSKQKEKGIGLPFEETPEGLIAAEYHRRQLARIWSVRAYGYAMNDFFTDKSKRYSLPLRKTVLDFLRLNNAKREIVEALGIKEK